MPAKGSGDVEPSEPVTSGPLLRFSRDDRGQRALPRALFSMSVDIHEPTETSVAPTAAPALPRVEVLGVPLALTNYEGAMDWMDTIIAARERVCLSAAAVHLVMVAREDE